MAECFLYHLLNKPQLLLFNPDAFAKKMRILKLDILGLKRENSFDSNEYSPFYHSSPATLITKKNYCINNGIDYRNTLSLLLLPWRKIIKRVDKTFTDAEADKEGNKMTIPNKKRYDNWMREYKNRCLEFYRRRGRRLILKV